MKVEVKVGDVAIENLGTKECFKMGDLLCCGSGRYSHAIVVSVDPFVMVSEEGDMLWEQEDPKNYCFLCQAHQSVQDKAMDRWMHHCKQRKIGIFAKDAENQAKLVLDNPWKPIASSMDEMAANHQEFEIMRNDCRTGTAYYSSKGELMVNLDGTKIWDGQMAYKQAPAGLFFSWRRLD